MLVVVFLTEFCCFEIDVGVFWGLCSVRLLAAACGLVILVVGLWYLIVLLRINFRRLVCFAEFSLSLGVVGLIVVLVWLASGFCWFGLVVDFVCCYASLLVFVLVWFGLVGCVVCLFVLMVVCLVWVFGG